MIRPFTFLTAALALASGFYLYQAKHRTQLLDGRISAIEQHTATAESRIAVLRAEWALENSPSRLADLAAHYLLLVPMTPTQAVSMANLASRLPPPAEPGTTAPVPGESDLVAASSPRLLGRYASLEYYASGPSPAASGPAPSPQPESPPAVVAHVSAPPVTPLRPDAPSTLARLPSETESPPAAPPRSVPHLASPTLVAAAPAPSLPLRAPPPAPVLTSALGGSYPSLPPPAPLSGSH